MSQYLNEEQPPICLHTLGQSLVTALWTEGRELKKELDALRRLRIHIATKSPESSIAESFNESISLENFVSFEVDIDSNSFVFKKVGDQTTYGDLYGNDSIKLELEVTK